MTWWQCHVYIPCVRWRAIVAQDGSCRCHVQARERHELRMRDEAPRQQAARGRFERVGGASAELPQRPQTSYV